MMDFTPAATAPVYTQVTGTVTLANNLQSCTLTANPVSSAEEIVTFGTAGSTQTVNLGDYPTVPMTPQTITFTQPLPVTWSPTSAIPPIQLVATGGLTGNPVILSIVSGTGTLSGANNSILTVKDIGTTVVAANQAGGLANGVYYSAASQVTQTTVVNPIGTVAAPTFSVAAGTYTAVQSVTISESTPGATVYYTTNGNTPTISSPVYTGSAISIGITTTIKAIAVETGYTSSTRFGDLHPESRFHPPNLQNYFQCSQWACRFHDDIHGSSIRLQFDRDPYVFGAVVERCLYLLTVVRGADDGPHLVVDSYGIGWHPVVEHSHSSGQ